MIKKFVPQVLIDFLLFLYRPLFGFTGNYKSWMLAIADSKSYEDPNIVEQYKNSLIANQSDLDYAHFVGSRELRQLAAIAFVALSNSSLESFSVLDVGGSVGSHKKVFQRLSFKTLEYEIIESPAVVNAMNKLNKSDLTWNTSPSKEKYDVIFSSGTIQCLESGLANLKAWSKKSNWIILDRVPLIDSPRSLIKRQNVILPKFKRTSYPSWFFSGKEFYAEIGAIGEIVFQWEVPEDSPIIDRRRTPYQGFLIKCNV